MVTTLEYDIKLNSIRLYMFYDNVVAFNLRIELVRASKSTKSCCRRATCRSDQANYGPFRKADRHNASNKRSKHNTLDV